VYNSKRQEALILPKDDWTKRFEELCYKVMYQNIEGQELLVMNETRYFYGTPVAVPGMDPSFAFFREGYNECLRSFRNGYNEFMKPKT